MAATLDTWDCDGLRDVATLLVSELVANAVLHAGGSGVRVLVRHTGSRVRVEVWDGDARPPVRKHYSSTATTGRGLMLVDQLATQWGVSRRDDGKRVWFELDEAELAAQPGEVAGRGIAGTSAPSSPAAGGDEVRLPPLRGRAAPSKGTGPRSRSRSRAATR